MTFFTTGKIKDGKIIPLEKLPSSKGEIQIKIFVFQKTPLSDKSECFGKLKGVFGDGLRYQKKMRSEWK